MKPLLIQFRILPKEKQAFQDAADMAGISLSAWIRTNLRRAAIRELSEVGKQAAFLKLEDENAEKVQPGN